MAKKRKAPAVTVVRDRAGIEAALADTVETISEAMPWLADVSEEVPAVTPGRLVAGQPSTVHLEDALAHWQLAPEDVLAWRGGPEVGLMLVTAGGRKLAWPADMARVLTDGDRGGRAPHPGLYPGGYLRRKVS